MSEKPEPIADRFVREVQAFFALLKRKPFLAVLLLMILGYLVWFHYVRDVTPKQPVTSSQPTQSVAEDRSSFKQPSDIYYWNRLGGTELEEMAAQLKARGPRDVRILACPTPDCAALSDDFDEVFVKADWHVTDPTTPLAEEYKGLLVSITKESAASSRILAEVLRQHGYEVGFWGDPDHQTTAGTSIVWLLIGMKGHPGTPS